MSYERVKMSAKDKLGERGTVEDVPGTFKDWIFFQPRGRKKLNKKQGCFDGLLSRFFTQRTDSSSSLAFEATKPGSRYFFSYLVLVSMHGKPISLLSLSLLVI